MKPWLAAVLGIALVSSGTAFTQSAAAKEIDVCSGTYPSYWQDPKFPAQWEGQTITDAPDGAWKRPVFRLMDQYPTQRVDDAKNQPWRHKKFDALFKPQTSAEHKRKLAEEYAWAVLKYVQAGNTHQESRGYTDFDVCKNKVRPWYHMPYQTYDALSGREFTHGLTREAPVTFSTKDGSGTTPTTMWAIGVFNATAAYTIGQSFGRGGKVTVPTNDVSFDEGAVVGKPLFNTATVEQMPMLANMPAWKANISNPSFCGCTGTNGASCTLVQESQQCGRSYAIWPDVRLLQFDIAVKDSRAPVTGWVFGTFVADGARKAKVKDPWQRMSMLGLMWGNDTPPAGQLAFNYPADPRKGFKEAVMNWEFIDYLNSNNGTAWARTPGHLGCNQRLNGPADNANSSCMSCHGTASVPDKNLHTPQLVSQFAPKSAPQTAQCVAPFINTSSSGMDRSGSPQSVVNGIPFATTDAVYFANTPAGKPFITPFAKPDYGNGRDTWISLDYSMQLSIALTQWLEWQANQQSASGQRKTDAVKHLRR